MNTVGGPRWIFSGVINGMRNLIFPPFHGKGNKKTSKQRL